MTISVNREQSCTNSIAETPAVALGELVAGHDFGEFGKEIQARAQGDLPLARQVERAARRSLPQKAGEVRIGVSADPYREHGVRLGRCQSRRARPVGIPAANSAH